MTQSLILKSFTMKDFWRSSIDQGGVFGGK